MVCKNCGFDNNDQSKFCVSCGTVLDQPIEETAEQPVEQPTSEQSQQPNYQQPYNQQQYNGYNPYAPQQYKAPGKGFAIAAMVLGIVSFFCTPIVTGVLGIIFGCVAKSKGYRGGMATAGIVCGILGLIGWVLTITVFNNLITEFIEEMMYY